MYAPSQGPGRQADRARPRMITDGKLLRCTDAGDIRRASPPSTSANDSISRWSNRRPGYAPTTATTRPRSSSPASAARSEIVELIETLAHNGVFTGSVMLKAEEEADEEQLQARRPDHRNLVRRPRWRSSISTELATSTTESGKLDCKIDGAGRDRHRRQGCRPSARPSATRPWPWKRNSTSPKAASSCSRATRPWSARAKPRPTWRPAVTSLPRGHRGLSQSEVCAAHRVLSAWPVRPGAEAVGRGRSSRTRLIVKQYPDHNPGGRGPVQSWPSAGRGVRRFQPGPGRLRDPLAATYLEAPVDRQRVMVRMYDYDFYKARELQVAAAGRREVPGAVRGPRSGRNRRWPSASA